MKTKNIILTIALALTLGTGVASAQKEWEFGVKAGMAMNMMPRTTIIEFDEFRPNIGFQGGGYACVYLSDNLLGQVELVYSRKGVSTINQAGQVAFGGAALKYSRNIHYIQVPVLIGFHSYLGDKLKFMLGPELNICLGNEIKANYYDKAFMDEKYNVAPINLGFALQAMYFITDSFGVDLEFDLGLTRTFKKETQDKGRNAAVQLGVCYRFGY